MNCFRAGYPRPQGVQDRLSDELTALVSRLSERLLEEGNEAVQHAQATFDQQRAALEDALEAARTEHAALQRQYDSQRVALDLQAAELQICQTSLQAEITRNARISQSCHDLELRVGEKDEHIQSLEDKHLHARDALEHYRNAVKEQREQDQQRHEGQVQQVQLELRQLQQIQVIKQDELTRLNRDNERLLGESRHQAKALVSQEDLTQRLVGEIGDLKTAIAKAEGAKEMLQEQLAQSRAEAKSLAETAVQADERTTQVRALLGEAEIALTALRQAHDQEQVQKPIGDE